MKNIILTIVALTSMQAFSFEEISNKVIYGDDNRRLMTELDAELDKEVIEQSSSVLAQIPNWRIDFSDKTKISIQTKNLQKGINYCADERFSELPSVSSCTAFLVSPDLIITAGHCVKDKYDCKKQTWVLDYNSGGEFISPMGAVNFERESTYQCAELVSWSNNSKLDYSLIRLDRKVIGRKPLKLRRSGKVNSDETLTVIGHPLGLPKIIGDFVTVRENNLDFTFKTNADTFSGNSGSPLIGSNSKLVEGVLIKGDDDFELDIDLQCQRTKRCREKECKGETFIRSTVLPLKYIPNN